MSKNLFYLFAAVTVSAVVYTTYLFTSSNNTTAAVRQFNTPNLLPVDSTAKADAYQVNKKVIYNVELNENNTIVLVGEIGSESLDIAQQITEKGKSGKPLYLFINSPGGSVIDGAQIVSAIQGAKSPIYTICGEICASMGAIVHQFGTKRYMLDRSILMFHEASGSVQGQFNQMKTRLAFFDRMVGKLDYEVAIRAHKNPETFRASLASEIWLDAEDCVSQGYADGLITLSFHSSSNNDLQDKIKLSQTNSLDTKVRIQY